LGRNLIGKANVSAKENAIGKFPEECKGVLHITADGGIPAACRQIHPQIGINPHEFANFPFSVYRIGYVRKAVFWFSQRAEFRPKSGTVSNEYQVGEFIQTTV
jgi:hypothetical protein